MKLRLIAFLTFFFSLNFSTYCQASEGQILRNVIEAARRNQESPYTKQIMAEIDKHLCNYFVQQRIHSAEDGFTVFLAYTSLLAGFASLSASEAFTIVLENRIDAAEITRDFTKNAQWSLASDDISKILSANYQFALDEGLVLASSDLANVWTEASETALKAIKDNKNASPYELARIVYRVIEFEVMRHLAYQLPQILKSSHELFAEKIEQSCSPNPLESYVKWRKFYNANLAELSVGTPFYLEGLIKQTMNLAVNLHTDDNDSSSDEDDGCWL